MEIKNKVIIVTGASGGIGLAAAKLLSEHEANVVLVARSTEKIQKLSEQIPNSFAVTADMRDEIAIRQMISQVHSHYGRIDALVNNAGQGMHVSIENANLDQFRSIFELNVVGVLAAMQAVIPLMCSQTGGGVIVNISSGLTKRIVPTVGPYAATKYALNAISLTARMELAKDNIRVGLVYPSMTQTDFFKNTISREMTHSDRMKMMPMDTAESVAEKIVEAIRTEEAEVYVESLKQGMK
ncbi:MAG: SDR family oxidoreductase [Ignavibacteria bacterium]|jgi:NADP-dependent 3-hydroxy acid dehydrogenase YdfG|nr:SDR family oxidoreductase [Ignavibacteria bacterium]MCU7502155.1 SDR family oxidoreductase [Ignavibacteria bacterium]MCU7515557.1 SDR family oxidoreductase [Ignavibacteria bacterium]